MRLCEWPEQERPREKLLHQGAAALSDSELLAVLLRVGIKGKTAIDLGRELLHHFGSLHSLLHADIPSLAARPGMGLAKSAQFHAMLELARRTLHEDLHQNVILNSPKKVGDYLKLQLAHLPHEVFAVLLLDNQYRLIQYQEMFRGTLNQTAVYPREVVKLALQHNAAAVILAHNHPSGSLQASPEDEHLTEQLRQALACVDIQVVDHLIIAGHQHPYSFAERGRLAAFIAGQE